MVKKCIKKIFFYSKHGEFRLQFSNADKQSVSPSPFLVHENNRLPLLPRI